MITALAPLPEDLAGIGLPLDLPEDIGHRLERVGVNRLEVPRRGGAQAGSDPTLKADLLAAFSPSL
jgi:hypothetical protein